MGTMLLPTVLCILIGTGLAVPMDELRSNLEWMDYSTNVAESAYRLLDTIQPRTMRVDLDVFLNEARFDGIVSMDIEVLASNIEQIVFHQNVVSIQGVNLVTARGDPVGLKFPDPFTIDRHYELLLINLAQPIAAGNYTVTVRYRGQINTNPVDRGFYRGYYYVNNQLRYYATTQFQPFHARKAFPCFDEPQFKSIYIISITRDRSLSPTYSNMPISNTETPSTNRVKETFFPTPIVSSYLVAFHVSDFVETSLTGTDSRPFGIISRQGVTSQHEYAAKIGLKITDKLDDYFGILYHEMGQGTIMKNDHIALPDFPSGAMENWGMVNYREAYLLYDPQHTNLINKIFIATIMAHELAHKWFGNLVTCFWWSNLWLNESFASFYEYFGAHYADPSLELDDQFVVDYVHSALTWDAGTGATPMNWTEVSNNSSISSHFSTTSYAKGASVLRMMEHFLGSRTFRNGLRYYLRDNAYGIGTPADLYAALRRAASEDHVFARDFPNVDVGEILDSWVQNPGSPVINVEFNTNNGVITLTQERFLLTGSRDQLWRIPITWTDATTRNFSNTRPSLIMNTRTVNIQGNAGQHWVMLNIAQSGLYRVNYDDSTWQRIAAFLRTNREAVHKLNRAQIVNDVLFFIRAGKITTSRAFDVLSFLENERDYYVWAGAITQLEWIRRRLEHLPQAHEAFTAYTLDLLRNVINHLGYNERATDSTSTILNRMQILNLACNLGHSGCISDSLQKWRQFRNNPTNLVPVNSRRYVYCVGVRQGNSSDYNFLFERYNASQNTADMVVMLRALACTRDTNSLQHYMFQSMHNDRIRIHDRTNAFSYALQGNRENLPIVLNFLYQNFAAIRTSYGGEARLVTAVNAISGFLTDFAIIREFQSWVYANQLALGTAFSTGVSVINSAISNLEWGNAEATDIYNFLLARSSSTTVTSSFILMITALVVKMFH
ncbi:aminopeptidase N isoform X1 [Bombyx mori]|uniref:Aminopeptidase n=2 Tax=Bombyx TaxID=7090 RepID=A0A8R2C9Y8_BOMMO|nr:aminopeptidase N isoform X1 [Bombyx mori]